MKRIISIILSFIFGVIGGIFIVKMDYFRMTKPQETLVVSPSLGNGITIKANADNLPQTVSNNAVLLTATIEPSHLVGKVDWSIAWKNPSSTWASGKKVTDYATITPTSPGALTATVQCLQAFGEQIIVTVRVRFGTWLSATCTLDYLKRGQFFELSYLGDGSDDTDHKYSPYLSLCYPTFYNVAPTDIGTRKGQIDIGYIDSFKDYYPLGYVLSSDFMKAVYAHADYQWANTLAAPYDLQFNVSGQLFSREREEVVCSVDTFFDFSHYEGSTSNRNNIEDYLSAALEETSTAFALENKPVGYIEVRGTYSYSTWETDIEERFDFYGIFDS